MVRKKTFMSKYMAEEKKKDLLKKKVKSLYGSNVSSVIVEKNAIDINYKSGNYFIPATNLKKLNKLGYKLKTISTFGTSGISLLYRK